MLWTALSDLPSKRAESAVHVQKEHQEHESAHLSALDLRRVFGHIARPTRQRRVLSCSELRIASTGN